MASNKNQYLTLDKHGYWMFQIFIPAYMRHLCGGKRLLRRSTGTYDLELARDYRDHMVIEWNKLKAQLKPDTHQKRISKGKAELYKAFGMALTDEAEIFPDALANALNMAVVQTKGIVQKDSILLHTMAKEYQAEYVGSRSPSTLSKHALSVKLFLEHMGPQDTALTDITRTDVTRFVRELKPQKSAQTIQNYLSGLNSVYEYARRCYDNIPAASPFTGHRLEAKSTVKSYEPFTEADISILIKTASEDLQDVILIGLYSGMRLNEIASLEISDVQEIDGIGCLRVQASKTKAGVRLVPIHPALVSIIEKYRRLNEQTKYGRYLLPKANAIKRADAKRGPWFSQQFTRLRNKTLPNSTDRQCFHSLRGMFITALDRTGVPEDRIAQIVGHERGKTESFRTYSQGAALKELAKYVALVPLLMIVPND
ncbi:tyrosine-type recombinase/integrase [Rouxiella badensis]|uniref:site-specific integrase n=1 Tax=Rouxiella badensis TaxID=1646377 RepID=UPI001D13CD54|nr:tyrosine-type recombinase/integrase [Rouxiella badensis]MCC3733497.1 tyrosine-type recombinase/integrase [Rouxiella badensis]MCC3757852.1 tyrosine-type recombinase/integrase [Rouxiella badensis]